MIKQKNRFENAFQNFFPPYNTAEIMERRP
jgi:hypothetical protein